MTPDDPLQRILPPADRRLALRVTDAAELALRRGHPWLFDRAIMAQSDEGRPGDLAVIFDDRRRFLAIGLYDPTSPIRVRVLEHGTPATIDESWLCTKLSAAVAEREELAASDTTGYRLVHGENDGFPGLVIDRYETTLVAKLYTLAWVPWLPALRAALEQVCPGSRLVLRLSRELTHRPEYLCGLTDGAILAGHLADSAVLFSENGLRFEADVIKGQKTGFFLDQRENRARVGRLAAGRRTLNVFAYSGGFSLYAGRGGAPEVVSLDISTPALEAAQRNFALNRHLPTVAATRHEVLAMDAFASLQDMRRNGRRFDLVIVDPPAMAKQAEEVSRALQAYVRLARLSLDVMAPGGTLVMASCSSRVSAPDFYAAIHQAAARAGRPIVEIERTGHPVDHPVRFPEGAYLKCLFATVP